MAYIREQYGVPAKRGGRVRLGPGFGRLMGGWTGTITSADGPYLKVRFDPPNDKRVRCCGCTQAGRSSTYRSLRCASQLPARKPVMR